MYFIFKIHSKWFLNDIGRLRGTVPSEKYIEGCEIVIKQGTGIRSVAISFGMCHVILFWYIAKYI